MRRRFSQYASMYASRRGDSELGTHASGKGVGFVMLMLASIGIVRVAMWGDGPGFMLTIGATLIAIPLMGCTVGSMLPLLLRRLGVDPATSSTPFIATLIDVLGIVVYFNVAQVMLAEVLAAHMHH